VKLEPFGQKLAHKVPVLAVLLINGVHPDVLLPTGKPAYPGSQAKSHKGDERECASLTYHCHHHRRFHPDYGNPLWPSLPFASRPRT